MSRSSTDALAIGLGTCEIAIGRRSRARVKRPALETAPCPVRTVAIESALHYTEDGLIDALAHALDDTGDAAIDAAIDTANGMANGMASAKEGQVRRSLRGRAMPRAALVLDDFWGRHAILRGDFRNMRARELDEVAGAYFADTFGVDGHTLAVRWQAQPGGRTLFASALPRVLVDGIRDTLEERHVDVASITLALPQTLNRVRSSITASDGWLLVATDTLLHAVAIGEREWSAYDTERLFREGFGYENPDSAADAIADTARQIVERCASPNGAHERVGSDVYLCGLALDVDAERFERSFARFVALTAHMSHSTPAVCLMELAS